MDTADSNNFVGSGFKAVFQKSEPVSEAIGPPPLGPASPLPVNAPALPVLGTTPAVPAAVNEPEITTIVSSSSAPKKELRGKGGKGRVILAVFLILLLGGLVAGFGKIRSFLSQAEGNCSPENLAEANLSEGSVEVVFQTGKACQMEVAYGISSQALLLQVPESMASLNHRIRLAPLLASTTYYYQVVAEGKKVGTVHSFLTKAPILVTPTEKPEIVATPTSVPTVIPTATATSSASTAYVFEDFKSQFGGDNPSFDIDQNGVVNMADWLKYKKEH